MEETCETCSGDGVIELFGFWRMKDFKVCPTCGGYGKLKDERTTTEGN